MHQNWYNQQKKEVENFWMFELHLLLEFVKSTKFNLDYYRYWSHFFGTRMTRIEEVYTDLLCDILSSNFLISCISDFK